jgi:hypothetical protein
MPPEHQIVDDPTPRKTAGEDTTVHATSERESDAHAYAPFGQDEDWLEQAGELSPRPRRRLLAAGRNPTVLVLLGVLLTACGFIGGVLVEKGQSSPAGSTSGATARLTSRFAALRQATAGGAGASAGGGLLGAGAGTSGGARRPLSGQVAYLAGNTLYVTDLEGNTVKVDTSPATAVTKTVTAKVASIHPGETVAVTGATASNGVVSAESIRVGAGGGGLAALFGGAGGGAGARAAGAGDGPALFGSGS